MTIESTGEVVTSSASTSASDLSAALNVKKENMSDTEEKNDTASGDEQQASTAPTLPGKEELNQICSRVRSIGRGGAAGSASTSSGGGGGSNPQHPIAEFLYQLTKMLSDDNQEIIEWSQGRIKVHFPDRLENELLHKYFRHSKYASFQRQLNYFGFRKIAGKGKMSPCSYVNDAATDDIRSLLLIKRKTNGSAARKAIAANKLEAEKRKLEASASNDLLLSGLSDAAARQQLLLNAGLAPQMGLPGAGVSAVALLQENALRAAGLGQPQLFGGDNALAAAALRQQQGGQGLMGAAGLAGLQSLQGRLGAGGLGLPDQGGGAINPATAAMNAALASGQNNNDIESIPNWNQLSGASSDQAGNNAGGASAAVAAAAAARQGALAGSTSTGGLSGQNLLNRSLLADNLSTASLSHLLNANNRVSSLLSLSGLLSREPSVADLIASGANRPPFPSMGFEPTPFADLQQPGAARPGGSGGDS